MRKALRDNGLTLVLLLLFLLSIIGQSLAGLAHFNDDQRDHGRGEVTLTQYITSAQFAESVFENWESEFLQMAVYVVLTAFLYQRGSAESKDPDKREDVDEDPQAHVGDPAANSTVRAGGWWFGLYQHSLSLALFLLFVVSFVLHLVASAKEDCAEKLVHGQTCTTTLAFIASSKFWFESLQNWQSEFLSVAILVVLSIFLRQKGSPESKPVHAPHSATGR
jgi:membrane protein implicated in regulation of membrane protease activity